MDIYSFVYNITTPAIRLYSRQKRSAGVFECWRIVNMNSSRGNSQVITIGCKNGAKIHTLRVFAETVITPLFEIYTENLGYFLLY